MWPFLYCPASTLCPSSALHSFWFKLHSPCSSRSKTNTPSSLGLLLVISWASCGSVHPIESTPNKVSQQRARSRAERRGSRSSFSRSQPKHSLVHLSFLGQFLMHNINESQLFLCLIIRKFIFGQRSIACKTFCMRLLVLADRSLFFFIYRSNFWHSSRCY